MHYYQNKISKYASQLFGTFSVGSLERMTNKLKMQEFFLMFLSKTVTLVNRWLSTQNIQNETHATELNTVGDSVKDFIPDYETGHSKPEPFRFVGKLHSH